MHSIGKAALEAAVGALVKEAVSGAVQAVKGDGKQTKAFQASVQANALQTRAIQASVQTNALQIRAVQREIDNLKSKLDGIAKRDLLASISFFDEGYLYLCKVFGVVNAREDGIPSARTGVITKDDKLKVSFPPSTAWLELLTLAKGLKHLDDSTMRALCDAKKRFEDARRKATKAFCNETLSTNQRILAMRYRVAATILEKIDNPAEALPACKLCLEELHSTPSVQECFVLKSTILADIRDVNSVICDVTQIIRGGGALLTWPCIAVGDDRIDPLHDRTMEHCCLTWSFGQKGEEEHKLKFAWSIASNSQGQFIVGDRVDRNIKVFYESGELQYCLYPFVDEVQSEYEHEIWNVACDQQDNIYVLALKRNHDGDANLSEVFVFNKYAHLTHKFALTEGFRGYSLTVDEFSRVLVTGGGLNNVHNNVVEVYESDGGFLQSFGKGILSNVQDIAAAYDGYWLVLDTDEDSACIRVFDAEGHHLNRFSIRGSIPDTGSAVVFHRASETVLVASLQSESRVEVSMYSKEFKFVRVVKFEINGGPFITGITATVNGYIAVPAKNTVLFV